MRSGSREGELDLLRLLQQAPETLGLIGQLPHLLVTSTGTRRYKLIVLPSRGFELTLALADVAAGDLTDLSPDRDHAIVEIIAEYAGGRNQLLSNPRAPLALLELLHSRAAGQKRPQDSGGDDHGS